MRVCGPRSSTMMRARSGAVGQVRQQVVAEREGRDILKEA